MMFPVIMNTGHRRFINGTPGVGNSTRSESAMMVPSVAFVCGSRTWISGNLSCRRDGEKWFKFERKVKNRFQRDET